MRGVYKNLSSVLVASIVFLVMIGSIIVEDKEISNIENRRLQVIPTVDRIVDEGYNINAYIYEALTGELFKKWDNYFSDHIIYRHNMVNTYTHIQEALDRKYINSAYIGEDNYILTDINVEMSEDDLKEAGDYYNLMAEKVDMDKMYLIRLPSKNEMYEEKIPLQGYEAITDEKFEILEKYLDEESVVSINMYDYLKGVDDLYFKTDPHWNKNGTFLAYQNIINEISKDYPEIGESNSKDYYDIEIYEDYFVGTDGNRVGSLVKELDDIEIYKCRDESNYKVSIGDEEGKLFYEENLIKGESNNDYAVYLDGDNPEVIIENIKSPNDLEVVILGDSMDNPLMPLLASHFNKIYNYDLRHYKDNIEERIEEINPDIFIVIGLTSHILRGEEEIFKVGS